MKIHASIRSAADFNPTTKSSQITINDLCKYVDDGILSLPLYQRDVSWTLEKSVDLLNYELFGKTPLSAISVHKITKEETANEVVQIAFLTREPIKVKIGQQLSVVDGQQRISTNYKAYVDHDDFKNISLDLEKGRFLIVKGAIKDSQIPVGKLLNKDRTVYQTAAKKFDEDTRDLLGAIRQKFAGYFFTVNQGEDLTYAEQTKWFTVLNAAGSKVSDVQLDVIQMQTAELDFYTEFTIPFVNLVNDGLNADGLFKIQKAKSSAPLATLNPAYEVLVKGGIHSNNFAPIPSDKRPAIFKKLIAKEMPTFRACIDKTLEATMDVINFIKDSGTSVGTDGIIDRIDYIQYLVGYFIFNGEPSTPEEKDKLRNWIHTVNFRNQTNSSRRQLFSDLIEKKF